MKVIWFCLLLVRASLAHSGVTSGHKKLQRIGASCVQETKTEFNEVTANDVAKWHVFEYSDESTMPSRCQINCVFKRAGFVNGDASTFNPEKFHNTFNNIPLNVIRKCSKNAKDANELCDHAFLPFNCILKKYRKEIMRIFYGNDQIFENSEQVKNAYVIRAQERLRKMEG